MRWVRWIWYVAARRRHDSRRGRRRYAAVGLAHARGVEMPITERDLIYGGETPPRQPARTPALPQRFLVVAGTPGATTWWQRGRRRYAVVPFTVFMMIQEIAVRRILFAVAILLLSSALNRSVAQSKNLAERLGHPADSKLLIIHADDLGVAHSEDAASFDALDKGAANSASIMIPCPWLTEVAAYAKAHPDADLGLHLTLTAEWKSERWGPVESRDKVPSLFDPDGYLWPETEPAIQHIKADQAERELRAQVERAMAMGIHPTHLDSHMGVLFERPDLFAAYVKVAHEYKLPFLAMLDQNVPPAMRASLSDKDIYPDAIVIAAPDLAAANWKNFYLNAIQNLKPGLTEIIIHLAHDDAEMQAVTVDHPDYGAAWRQRDYDAITSPEVKKALADNHIILIGWKDIKKLVQ